jgi:hypothetical protein
MSSTDDLIEDDDAVELSDNELTSESHSTSVLKREQAQQEQTCAAQSNRGWR